MNLDDAIYPYVRGERFSNGLKVKLADVNGESIYRIELLESLVKGKRIIHLGCLDHIPLISSKMESNIWLHKRLDDVASRCLGVDINEDGIRYVRDQLGFNDVICGDVVKDDIPEIRDNIWDLILVGEVLEHVDNPVDFLHGIGMRYAGIIRQAIITVPNAFRISNFNYAFHDMEIINSDHRYWFTPYTLWKVIDRAGLSLIDIKMCQSFRTKRPLLNRNFLDSIRILRHPILRECIVARCQLPV
ncbi:MAG TPA: methyltransferase domain-containing protein [Methanotrichaceae archaeon]|nr:methyltransferase domain-containing protein [Methanotrichaceae archaeon]HQF16797.1 methyltransferase domain-containing protein [Methanotrichaceae archaeon]HQI90123.1 methyltransferase domain-containing protein [Methanotrichaceae archaeon]HQJ27854.1 methyltransferase domain-containing protein [Methanotrichaceae archaeon]